MDSSSIQENVEALQLIPHQQPIIEEEQLDIQIIPIEDHADVSATLERLSFYKASQKGLEYDNEPTFEEIQKTMLGVGYRKGNGPNQPLESTILKTGFSPTWRLLMAYISNSLGGNIGSKDQLNYMHQLITHGLINGVKLDYRRIIFNDLDVKLTNYVRHTSPAYARFISLILEKALGDSYVLSDEIGLKIPIMDNSIFSLDPSLLEVPISSHMVRVCQSESDLAVVSEDVAGILLCDNVSDGSPSVDPNLNEIVQKVKTKSITSLLDPKSKESTGVYKFKVVSNCLNEEVIADTTVAIGSGDQSLKDDCPVNSNQVCNYQNNVASFQEEIVGDTAVPTGSGENLKDDCPVISNQVCNVQNNVASFQKEIQFPRSGENLKDDCPVISNQVCNVQNNGSDQNLKDGCPVNSNEVCNYQNNGGDENLKDACHVNSNEVCNYDNDGGSFHEVQTESNLFAIMIVMMSVRMKEIMLFVEDVDRSSLNQSVLTVLIDHVRLLSNQVTSLINEQANVKDKINKLITSPALSTEASDQNEIKDEVNKLNKTLSSKSLTYDILKDVISAIEPKLKNIKDHISKVETPSFPSKESLVVEFVKCIETTNSLVSKDVMHLILKQKELIDESVTGSFSKTKVNIHAPEDFMTLSHEFAALPAEIRELRSTMNDIVIFKVEISNLANKTQENVSTFKEFCVYFSNLQNSVNVFENLVEESIPTKKEREEDQELFDVISMDQGIIKGKISKIGECMLLLVKWAKSIYVDDLASTAKTIVCYEETPSKQAEFEKDFTELPLDPESNVLPASTIQGTEQKHQF
ncbi:hypothetical protein Tco_0163749 [Tanacetum coccineum]